MTQFPRLLAGVCLLGLALSGTWAAGANPEKVPQAATDRVVVYEVLLSEFHAQRGEPGTGFAYMLDAAQRSRSERLFERAVEMGLSARNANDALQAAQAWGKALPASALAQRYALQILIGLQRLDEAAPPLQRLLQNSSAEERSTHLALLPNYFGRVKDRLAAAATVQQALAPDLNHPQRGAAAWAALARMQAFAGDEASALQALQKSAALDPESDEAALAALQIGGTVAQSALPLVQRRLDARPGVALRMATMRGYIDAQNYAAAYDQLTRLTTEAPTYPEAWLVKGSIEVQNNDLARAQASLDTFLKLSEKPPAKADADVAQDETTPRSTVEALLLLATIAERNKEYAKANEYLDSIYSPQHVARIAVRRASIAASQGQTEQARAILREIPAVNAETLRTRYNAELQLLREGGQWAQAYELAAEAAQALPDDPTWRYEQAMFAEKLGRLSDMERLLRALIASHPQYHPPYNALGYSLADRNVALPEARQLITKALEFAPDDAYIIDSMGWVEYRSGNLPEARRLLEKAFAAQPDAEIAAHLGEVRWKMGDTEGARAVWKRGLQLNPRNTTLLDTLSRFQVRP